MESDIAANINDCGWKDSETREFDIGKVHILNLK